MAVGVGIYNRNVQGSASSDTNLGLYLAQVTSTTFWFNLRQAACLIALPQLDPSLGQQL